MDIVRTNETQAKVFETPNHKYFIHKSMSVERFKAYQKMQIELGYSIGFSGIYNALIRAYELLNKQQFADAAVLLHNSASSMKGMDEREHPVMVMCALFINREGENVDVVDEAVIQDKIDDWKQSGVPMDFFLEYSKRLVQDYETKLEKLLETEETTGPAKPSSSKKHRPK